MKKQLDVYEEPAMDDNGRMNHPLEHQPVGREILSGLRYDGPMMEVFYQFTEMRRGVASFGASFYVKVADFSYSALGEKRASKLKEFQNVS